MYKVSYQSAGSLYFHSDGGEQEERGITVHRTEPTRNKETHCAGKIMIVSSESIVRQKTKTNWRNIKHQNTSIAEDIANPHSRIQEREREKKCGKNKHPLEMEQFARLFSRGFGLGPARSDWWRPCPKLSTRRGEAGGVREFRGRPRATNPSSAGEAARHLLTTNVRVGFGCCSQSPVVSSSTRWVGTGPFTMAGGPSR